MRFLVLGTRTDVLDEGAKNVATNLVRVLSRTDEVLVVHQREAFRPANLLAAIRFRPEVVLSVHGPSRRTVVVLWLLSVLCGFRRSVIVGTQPHDDALMLRLMRFFRPALVFAQSTQWRERFVATGVRVAMLPNGVDTEKFSPRHSEEGIREFRRELGLKEDAPVVLHIGPLNVNRNHELLARLQQESEWQVVVVGSTTAPHAPEISEMLHTAGVRVLHQYFPDISRVYAMANVYLFPVADQTGSIEFPLTVLEAMACDRPVVTTRFRGLPDFLSEGEGFRFFSSFDELCVALTRVARYRGNRALATSFSWEAVAGQLRTAIAKKEAG